MSNSASTIGLPLLRASSSSSAVLEPQRPFSKASFAAATARSISFALASGTSAMICSVEGSYTGKVLPLSLAVHSPLMNIWYFCAVAMAVALIQSPKSDARQNWSAGRLCDCRTQRKRTLQGAAVLCCLPHLDFEGELRGDVWGREESQ